MEFFQEPLQAFRHIGILTLHANGIDNGERNTINGGKKCHLNTFYQRSHRGCHGCIICRLEILKSQYQTDKRTENPEAGKNIRHHFQQSLVDMDVDFLLIDKLIDISDAFFAVVDAVSKIVHLFIQIPVIKQFLQIRQVFRICLSRNLE